MLFLMRREMNLGPSDLIFLILLQIPGSEATKERYQALAEE